MASKDSNCSTLEEVKDHFEKRTAAISEILKYRPVDEDIAKKFCFIKCALFELKGVFKETRKQLVAERETVLDMQNLLERVENIMKRLDHMESNFPAVLKKAATIHEKKAETALNKVSKENVAPPDAKVSEVIAQVAYVTLKEFDAVPKYMKGRLKYEQINNFVTEFNAVITKKYHLMRLPRKELKRQQLDAVKKLKEQENGDTKGFYPNFPDISSIKKFPDNSRWVATLNYIGVFSILGFYFCTSDDLKEYGNIKPDKLSSSIITILRHCLKVKEIRSPGVVRYAIVV